VYSIGEGMETKQTLGTNSISTRYQILTFRILFIEIYANLQKREIAAVSGLKVLVIYTIQKEAIIKPKNASGGKIACNNEQK